MENLETNNLNLILSTVIYFIIHIIILIACIIIAVKKKSIATKLLLAGGILNVIGFSGQFILIAIARYNDGPEGVINIQIILSYINNIIFLVFGLGLLLFAVNDLKKT